MKFRESGLPDIKIVEDAFNFSFAHAMGAQKDHLKAYHQQIAVVFQQSMAMLEADREAGAVTEDEYKKHKHNIDRMREDQLKAGPDAIRAGLAKNFEDRRLPPIRELLTSAEKAPPELIAAMLLVECVRSPVDYQNVARQFGESVAGLISEIVHLDAYPSEREVNLQKASPDIKRAHLALIISSLAHVGAQIENVARENPLQRVVFPPGQEEHLFTAAQIVWGNDKKLDRRFADVFNKVAGIASSSFRIEANDNGAPELVKGSLQAPKKAGPKPPSGPNGGGLGGDVF